MSQIVVVVPAFRQAQFLRQSVVSALASPLVNRVLIADDASPDETPEVVAELCQEDERVETLRQPSNVGVSRNCNAAILSCPEEFVVRLDCDDALEPDYVERMVAALQRWPKAAYAHGAVREVDQGGRERRLRHLARKEEFFDAETLLRASLSGYRVSANIVTFRREAFAAVGGYDDRLSFAEDWDLAARLADAGWGDCYVPEVLARYRVWDDPEGVRARRFMTEIQGGSHVYRQTLQPAFERRGWDLSPLNKARMARARGFAMELDNPRWSEQDRAEIARLLLDLGDCSGLRRDLWLQSHGLGHLVRARVQGKASIKRLVKRLINRS